MAFLRALACMAGLAGAALADPGGQPPRPLTAAEIDHLRTTLLDRPLPVSAPGLVALEPARIWRGSADFFGRTAPPPLWDGKAIAVKNGTWRLEVLAEKLADPPRLSCKDGHCLLRAPLAVAADAALVIDGLSVRMSVSHGAALHNFGRLVVSDSVVAAWDMEREAQAETDEEGRAFRPYIAGFAASHTLLRRSGFLHLGHQGVMAYGLSFGTVKRQGPVTEHPSVDMIGNWLSDVYFGFFSFDADGVNIIDNHIAESHVYGIDPHDDTRNMLIHGNYVVGSRRSHGIILSRRIHDSIVSHNVSTGNGKAGIFLDKDCHDITLVGNDSFFNKGEGLVLHEVTRINVIDNQFHRNGGDGIRMRASSAIRIEGNKVTDNRRFGIRGYDWSFARRPPNAEEASQIKPVEFELDLNRIRGNRAGTCRLLRDKAALAASCPVPAIR